jgi:hypothetical protein
LVSGPNAALAIFRAADSVDDLLKACPLKFSIERIEQPDVQPQSEDETASLQEGLQDIEDEEPPRSSITGDGQRVDGEELLTRPSTLTSQPFTSTYKTSQHTRAPRWRNRQPPPPPPRSDDSLPTRTEFRVSADVWNGKHEDYLERSAYWGPFQVDTRSRIQQDLKRRVPLLGLSDIHNLKNYPFLRHLRIRQQEMASRMTVREYFERVKDGSMDQGDPPPNFSEETALQDQQTNPLRDLLIQKPYQPGYRKPLSFAEPPGVYQKDWQEFVVEAEEGRREKDHEKARSWKKRASPSRHHLTHHVESIPPQPVPLSNPVSPTQYGSLIASSPTKSTESLSGLFSPANLNYPESTDEQSESQSTSTGSSQLVGYGAKISSFFGLEEEPSPKSRYGSLMKSKPGAKRKKKKKGEELDDLAGIEAELRRKDY